MSKESTDSNALQNIAIGICVFLILLGIGSCSCLSNSKVNINYSSPQTTNAPTR